MTGNGAESSIARTLALGIGAFLVLVLAGDAMAQMGRTGPAKSIVATIIAWLPVILIGPPREFGGFALNIVVSFLAMTIGTVAGLLLGLGLISTHGAVRKVA